MSNQFDDVSMDLAGRHTRRGALRLFGAVIAGAVAATFRLDKPDPAEASALACRRACQGLSGRDRIACLHQCTCEASGGEICAGTSICCPTGTRCHVTNATLPIGVNEKWFPPHLLGTLPIGINGTLPIGINGTLPIGINGDLISGRVTCVPTSNRILIAADRK
jgi:hypothetical protein